MQVGFGNLGGVIAGFVYLSKDQPRFVTGHVILISSVSMSFVLTLSMTIFYRRENARRDAISATQNLTTESFNDELKLAERDKGDNALFFRYTV